MPRAKKTDDATATKDTGVKVKIRLTMTDEMLGTAPNDKNIYHTFIESKAPDALSAKEEIEMVGIDEYADKQITVFRRDPVDGSLILLGYLIKGFFKEACGALREVSGTKSNKLTSYKKKIDRLVFPQKKIKLQLPEDGGIGICERPLRAQTAQGDRVALACSESIPEGTIVEFELLCLNNEMWGLCQEWLDYGQFNGLGQWHNSGKGTFTWEVIEEL